ncbi:hypothetical protein An02g10590 [Aspergillus niger]|uniref:Uncharacterized protein n=2 Tax=Aspergillus niger TaxID=5061 RepID=A5AAG6_ASPNC|nr:hypothetical protein An02g10590 [Aspergillus niger]CAK44408.1 hypothetical protein An02g10590 [Aspergillus niger]
MASVTHPLGKQNRAEGCIQRILEKVESTRCSSGAEVVSLVLGTVEEGREDQNTKQTSCMLVIW